MKMGRPVRRREPEFAFGATSSLLSWAGGPGRHPRLSPRRDREHAGESLQSQGSARRSGHQVRRSGSAMQVVHERCCGLDVHKRTVVACVLTSSGREVRTFGTVTRELLRLADWLGEEQVSSLAMESTGVYWKPVYNLLEGLGIELVVVNAQHMKALPCRKTDVKDSEWIADLPGPGSAGAARAGPLPSAADRPAGGRGAPAPEGAGGRQHQARRRGHRRHGGQ